MNLTLNLQVSSEKGSVQVISSGVLNASIVDKVTSTLSMLSGCASAEGRSDDVAEVPMCAWYQFAIGLAQDLGS